eukprot:3542883-Amphidinium_carterae.1
MPKTHVKALKAWRIVIIPTSISACNQDCNFSVSCDTANDYEGTAVVTCGSGGGTFSYSGCPCNASLSINILFEQESITCFTF